MAGSGRRTFAPGEVLTASNVMNYLQDQTVMNFAGTAARGSAIGTAVAEGMVSYLQDTNVVQVYTGSSWDALAYSSSVSNPMAVPVIPTGVTVATGSGSYNSTTGIVTVSSAHTIKISNCFTSSYDNYIIQIVGHSSAGAYATFRYTDSSNTDISTANYAYSATYWDNAGNSGNYYNASGQTLGYMGYLYSVITYSTIITANVANPNLSRAKPMVGQGNQGGTNFNMASYFNTNTVAAGFNFLPSAAVNFTGDIRIFGVKKS